MFASDYDRKGTFGSYTFSIIAHLLALLMIMMYQQHQRKALADYTLTEINMIQQVPDEQKPVELEKPKKMFDFLKQLIPIKQTAQLALSKPQELKIEKPKMELSKPQALDMDKTKLDMKPAMKAIDLDNEVGKTKISPAMVQAQIALQKQQQLAQSPINKLNLNNKASSSSFLPMARPAISMNSGQMSSGLKQSSFKLGQPTPEQKKSSLLSENVMIEKKQALLIEGDVAGRRLITAKKPSYPRWLQDQGIEAAVTLQFAVTPDGTVKDTIMVEKTSGYTELDDLAKEALLQFKFEALSIGADQSGYATFRFMLER
jgi:TonB family protein